jgi:tol-pal system protein YbgF
MQKEVDDRIAALETQLKSQGLIELFNQVELLKADVARLRGQIEVLTYEQAEGQKRQRDLYVDLDTRLRKIEGGAAAPAAGATPSVPSEAASGPVPASGAVPALPPVAAPGAATAAAPAFGPPPNAAGIAAPGRPTAGDVSAEQHGYDAALDLFKAGNYGAAISGFGAFVKAYPKSPLAPSAQYWLGNAQFAQKDYRGAIASQRQLLAVYPDSQKVPDAMLNIATSQFEMGEAVASRRSLEDLIARYPQSEAAAKARQRLAGR